MHSSHHRRPICWSLILVCVLLGCGFAAVFEKPDNKLIVDYAKWLEKNESLFESYLGKNQKDIEAIFGKPKSIEMVKDPDWSYNEDWQYEKLPIGDAETYDFYFKNNKLIRVHVFGERKSA